MPGYVHQPTEAAGTLEISTRVTSAVILFFFSVLSSLTKAQCCNQLTERIMEIDKTKEGMCWPRPPAAITLPPRQPATKSALFSLILDVRLGLIQMPVRHERTQDAVNHPQRILDVCLRNWGNWGNKYDHSHWRTKCKIKKKVEANAPANSTVAVQHLLRIVNYSEAPMGEGSKTLTNMATYI